MARSFYRYHITARFMALPCSLDMYHVPAPCIAPSLVQTLMELQPRDAASGEGMMSPEQMVGSMSETILDKFGEKKFDVEDIARSLEEAGPYQNVFMQVQAPTLSFGDLSRRGRRLRSQSDFDEEPQGC